MSGGCSVLWCALLLTLVSTERCGDGHCKCSRARKTATCSSKKRTLNYFPVLPTYVKQLRYNDNYLPRLSRGRLVNLTKIPLEQLSLDDDGIIRVDRDAFVDLKHLIKLQISRNSILNVSVVADTLQQVSRSIEKLVLVHNKWASIPPNMFDGLQGSNISLIDLSFNNLISFNGTQLLKRIPRVKSLFLDQNPISQNGLEFTNMKELFKLSLQNTYLPVVPGFCDEFGRSSLPRLRSLYLDHTSIKSVSEKDFSCLPYLWKLSLSFTDLSAIHNNTFARLPVLKILILQNLVRLRRLDYLALNSSSLDKFQFGSSNFKFDNKGRYNNDLFKFASNITDLELFNNEISDGTTLKTLVWHLVRLKILNLQGCGLNYLQRGTFDRMPDLRKIILKGNNLNGWDPAMFSKLSNLRKLYLSGNNIAVVNRSSLDFINKTSLRLIDLSNNPFSCSCQQLWFRDWLKATKDLEVPSYPQRYVCRSPPEWDKTRLASFNYTQEDCREKNPWILIGSLLGSTVFLCTLAVVLVYRHLPTIRNVIYLLRLRRKGYVKLVNSSEYDFDCYIVSCEIDEAWVFNTLSPTLEEEHFYRLCVPSRDFDLGANIADQIEEKMQDSKKIIVVMSNDFAQDEWCQFQLEKAQERIRLQGTEVAVLIMLRDIDNKHMTSTIKDLLHKSSYATWVKGKIVTQLFWDIVLAAIEKPFGNPPIAV
uniref:Toll-like receptor 4 n=1 Tax=Crassostrea virginica TaxID=6565 RepID=A0A8B8CWX0_CRAVI|nr:toll-like receptor 13 [Crassostrea virginica]